MSGYRIANSYVCVINDGVAEACCILAEHVKVSNQTQLGSSEVGRSREENVFP